MNDSNSLNLYNNASTPSQQQEQPAAQSCCQSTRCCAPAAPVTRLSPKVGRNDPCPCDSGQKYKKCCGL